MYGFRRCTKCKDIKIEERDFSFRDLAKQKRSSRCKACIKLVSDAWYVANKDRHNNGNRKSRAAWGKKQRDTNNQLVNKIKSVPCKDCGVQYPHWIMDFDHVSGVKSGNVATMVHNCKPIEVLMEEISKCEVVCSNCHRDRTYKRRTQS